MSRIGQATVAWVSVAAWLVWEVVRATAQVAWDAVTPRSRLQPAIVAYPLTGRSPVEVTLLSNVVTLTPGTLTVEIEGEPPVMYVHGMYAGDPDEFRAELRAADERLVRAWRGLRRAPG